MFNLQGSEIVIVLLLALVVLGPEKLPDAMRRLGEFYAELKKMSSGFQSEFRAAIDEPMREVRDTANVLRDSADLTKLRDGEREEKPKSAEMGPVDDAAAAVPPESAPDVDAPAPDRSADEPGLAADSKPAPFSGVSSAAPRQAANDGDAGALRDGAVGAANDGPGMNAERSADEPGLAADSKPAPFSGVSSAAPRPATVDLGVGDGVDVPDGGDASDAVSDGSEAAEQPFGADDATGRAS